MSEEQKQEQQTENNQETEGSDEPQVTNSQVTNHPVFKKVTKEFADLRDKYNTLMAEKEEKAKKAEMKALEEKGNYEEAMAKKEAGFLEQIGALERKLVTKDLHNALALEGVTNPLLLKGIEADFSGDADSIGEYVSTLKEAHPELFQPVSGKSKQKALGTGAPASRTGTEDWEAMRKEMKDSNTSAQRAKEIGDKVREFMAANNNKMPW